MRLKDNGSKILFIHVEVQSYGSGHEVFGERMFRYFYRIWDKFRYKGCEKNNESRLRDNFVYYKETGSVNTR